MLGCFADAFNKLSPGLQVIHSQGLHEGTVRKPEDGVLIDSDNVGLVSLIAAY